MPAFFTKPPIRHVNPTDVFCIYPFPTNRYVQIHATKRQRRFFWFSLFLCTPSTKFTVDTFANNPTQQNYQQKSREKQPTAAACHLLHHQQTTSPYRLLSSPPPPPPSSTLPPSLTNQTSSFPSPQLFRLPTPFLQRYLCYRVHNPCTYVFPPLGHRSLV